MMISLILHANTSPGTCFVIFATKLQAASLIVSVFLKVLPEKPTFLLKAEIWLPKVGCELSTLRFLDIIWYKRIQLRLDQATLASRGYSF